MRLPRWIRTRRTRRTGPQTVTVTLDVDTTAYRAALAKAQAAAATMSKPPRPGPVCWGCDPSRVAALVRRLLRLQPAQHRCQTWIRYATTATACTCRCRSTVRVTDPIAARRAAPDFRPGSGCGR